MICDALTDLGYEDDMFDMLGGNVSDYVSRSYFRGYDSFIDPYSLHLKNLFREVMWTTFFNTSHDFSNTFDKVKRILIIFGDFCYCLLACFS